MPGMLRFHTIAGLAVAALSLAVAPSCTSLGARAYVGYTQTTLSGDIGLDSSGAGGFQSVDFEDDLGIDDASPSVWIKAEFEPTDLGRVSVSAFRFDENGSGTLTRDFGDISAGSPVSSSMRFDNVKIAWTYDVIDIGVFHLAPGVALDIIDTETSVSSVSPIVAFEEVQTLAPVPMLYLETGVAAGIASFDVEAGWMSIDLTDADGTYWDLEAMLRLSVAPKVEIVAGYRLIHVDGDGTADGKRFNADIDIDGWFLGGGFSF